MGISHLAEKETSSLYRVKGVAKIGPPNTCAPRVHVANT